MQSLSFKPIPVERKVEVICRVVKGEKIQPIAGEAGVDRKDKRST